MGPSEENRLSICAIEALESRALLAATVVRDINTTVTKQPIYALGSLEHALYLTVGTNGLENGGIWRRDEGASDFTLVSETRPGGAAFAMKTTAGELYYSVDSFIYRSDGTPAGTKEVYELPFVTGLPYAKEFTRVGKWVFFQRDTELYRTDGTPAGTSIIKQVTARNLVAFANRLFFTVNGVLWSSDGRSAGTRPASDLAGFLAEIDDLAVARDNLFFRAIQRRTGIEIWKTDGASPAMILKDIIAGRTGSQPSALAGVDGELYFSALGGLASGGSQLWRSDGTAEGTRLVTNIALAGDDGEIEEIAAADRQAFLVAKHKDTFSLWRTDGTAAGTILLMTAAPIDLSVVGLPPGSPFSSLTVIGSKLYFLLKHDASGPAELWSTDGTIAGTVPNSAPVQGLTNSNPDVIGAANGWVYFNVEDEGQHSRLWRSDGTARGTSLFLDFDPTPNRTNETYQAIAAGSSTYFTVASQGLWRSDGTAAGTKRIAIALDDVTIVGSIGTRQILVSAGGLWSTDGTEAGTKKLHAFTKSLNYFTPARGAIFFVTNDGDGNAELWKTDGTAAGTVLVLNRSGVPKISKIWSVLGWKDSLVFNGTGADGVTRLWKSDGTAAGTVPFFDLADAWGFTPAGKHLYFQNSRSIWRTDAVKTRHTNAIPGLQGILGTTGGVAIFTVHDVNNLPQLWRTDGSDAGTWILKAMPAEKGFDAPDPILLNHVADDGLLYFTLYDGEHGGEIWVTDGTIAGTRLLDDIWPGAGSSNVQAAVQLKGVLYFSARDPQHGQELQKLDTRAEVTGTVFDDLNVNGQRDAGEPVVSGKRVFIDANGSGAFDAGEQSAVSKIDGSYRIAGITGGARQVIIQLADGVRAVTGNTQSLFILPGSTNTISFGLTTTARVSGNVYMDADRSGSRGAGEAGLSRWHVFLDTNNNGVQDADEIGKNTKTGGRFVFDGLSAGMYTVRVVGRTGYRATYPRSLAFILSLAPAGTYSRRFGFTRIS